MPFFPLDPSDDYAIKIFDRVELSRANHVKTFRVAQYKMVYGLIACKSDTVLFMNIQ